MEENDIREDQFMYTVFPTLQSLKEMASRKVALSVWYHYYYSCAKYSEDLRKTSSDDLILHFGINDTYKEECHGMVKSLKLPQSVEDEIEYALWDVFDEMQSWIGQLEYCETPLDLSKCGVKRVDFNKIVWISNGFVHHEMSARKILSSIELSPAAKFSIMSHFCLEYEILNFDINSLPEDFMQQVTTIDGFSKYPLLNYWIIQMRYLKKESHLPVFQSPGLVKKYYERNMTAFRYFWHIFDSNDRESLVGILFSSDDPEEFYDHTYLYRYYNKERLFFMLSSQQQHSLLSRLCHKIILNFSRRPNCALKQSALWAWRQSKEFMSSGQFSYMMKFLLRDPTSFVCVYINIWKTAPDSFRQSLLNSDWNERGIISTYLDNYRLHCSGYRLSPSVCEFFIEFLSLKSANSRKRIITERADEFGSDINDLNSLQELLDLCLPDSDEQLEFKRKVADSPRFQGSCTELVNNLNFSELKTKLEFYLPDRSAVQEFIRQLLLDDHLDYLMIRFTRHLEDWDKFSNFIDEIFHGDASLSLDMKKYFISSLVSSFYGSYTRDRYYEADEMIQIAETIFVNEALEDLKRLFLQSIRRKFYDLRFWCSKMFSFKVDCTLRIISWCLRYSDEQTIREFKNNFLSVDIFFDGIFIVLKRSCARRDENFLVLKKCLFKLNRCLRWYMPNEEERKKFKRSRINETENFEIFEVLKSKRKRSDLEIILEWVFDNDEEAIIEFKLSKLKLE